MGYTGGTTPDPTYRKMGDHAEAIQIDYDPAQISYEALLDVFWGSHNPAQRTWTPQYMNAIFCHGDSQKRSAEASKDRIAAQLHASVQTQILPATPFYLAENYHQKYRLQGSRELLGAFQDIYPAFDDLVNSTAAARVNAYLDGYGSLSRLQAEVDTFGLPAPARKILLQKAEGRLK